MDHLGLIENFIAEMTAAQTLDDVFAGLRLHVERMGFERFTYELMWPEAPNKRPLFITSYPKDWIKHYVEKKYAGDDLVCRMAAQLVRPFVWPEISTQANLTQSQRLVFNEAADAGLRTGGTVPLHGPGSAKAYFAVANNMPAEEFIKLFAQQRHELHLLAAYAHERILALGIHDAPTPSIKLTPREIEVMTWTARGKTRWEISTLLSISEETVKAHLEHACRKLGVSNKTHATALAIIHGLIAP